MFDVGVLLTDVGDVPMFDVGADFDVLWPTNVDGRGHVYDGGGR